MASVIDFSFLANFSAVWTFLLIWVTAFALFTSRKVLGDNAAIHAFMAFLIAIIAAIFPFTNRLIANMAPWFVVFFIFVGILLVGYMLLGWSESDLSEHIKKVPAINWAMFIVGIIIFITALSSAFGPGLLDPSANQDEVANDSPEDLKSPGGGDFQNNVRDIIFNPKVLGMIFILLVATSTIGILGGTKTKMH